MKRHQTKREELLPVRCEQSSQLSFIYVCVICVVRIKCNVTANTDAAKFTQVVFLQDVSCRVHITLTDSQVW